MRNFKNNNKQKTINVQKDNNKNKIKFLNKSNSQGKIINKSLPKGKYYDEQLKISTQNSLNKNKYNNILDKNNSKKNITENKNQSKTSNNEKNNNYSSTIFMKYRQFQLNNNLDTGSNEMNNQNLKQSNSKVKLTKNNDILVNKFNTNINTNNINKTNNSNINTNINTNNSNNNTNNNNNNINKYRENHYSINNYQSFNNYIYIFQKNSRTNSVKIRSPDKDYIFSNDNKLTKNINFDDKDNILQKTIKLFNEHPSPRELNNYHSNNIYFNNIINYNKNFYTNKYNNSNNEHFRLYSFGSFGSELNNNNNINKNSYEKKIVKNKSFNNIL